MSQQDNEQTNNLIKSQHEKGSCDQEPVADNKNDVATQNAVESKTIESQHGTEIMTQNLLRGQKNVVATKMNIAGNINDVAT